MCTVKILSAILNIFKYAGNVELKHFIVYASKLPVMSSRWIQFLKKALKKKYHFQINDNDMTGPCWSVATNLYNNLG